MPASNWLDTAWDAMDDFCESLIFAICPPYRRLVRRAEELVEADGNGSPSEPEHAHV